MTSTSTVTAERIPVFAIAEQEPKLPLVAPGQPSTKTIGLAIDRLMEAGKIAERHRDRSFRHSMIWMGGTVPSEILGMIVGSNVASNDDTQMAIMGVTMGVWAALGAAYMTYDWWSDRKSMLAVQPLEPVRELGMTSLEQGVLAEAASRCRTAAESIWFTKSWRRGLDTPQASGLGEQGAKAIRQIFDGLFALNGLVPHERPVVELEPALRAIESFPIEQRGVLATLAERAFAGTSPAPRSLAWYQQAQIRALCAGRAFRFSEQIASDTPPTTEHARERDLAVQEIEYAVQRARTLGDKAPRGVATVADIELAVRVAAHLEAKGLRVALTRTADPTATNAPRPPVDYPTVVVTAFGD